MPELPEVETVKRGLEDMFESHPRIEQLKLLRPDLRFPIPKSLPGKVQGAAITGVRRRAKYLLIDTDRGTLLSHLGMTGSWRLARDRQEKRDTHDHIYLDLTDGRRLVFRDPRRFGLLDFIAIGGEAKHVRLRHLGPEPLSEEFTADYVFTRSRKRKVAVKTFIMAQEIVVGVGNIYASEALFLAGIKPTKLATRLTREECAKLVQAIVAVLRAAIAAGGSSISDYRQTSGAEGDFQNAHQVYDRKGELCPRCGARTKSRIQAKVIGGRSTYWCAKCQT